MYSGIEVAQDLTAVHLPVVLTASGSLASGFWLRLGWAGGPWARRSFPQAVGGVLLAALKSI